MERKNTLVSNEAVNNKLQTLSTLVNRAKLSASLGQQQYGGDRDIYQALGYPTIVTYEQYAARYSRQDIAKAVIDRPAKATWQGVLKIQEYKDDKETGLETAWTELNKTLGLKNHFSRVDRLSGIGCYGVLLLGLDDVKAIGDFQKPVTKGTRKLVYLKPFGEGAAQIHSFETEPTNPRYGKPLLYNITIADTNQGSASTVGSTGTTINVMVHYTRVIHVIDDILENDVIGTPRLESIFNRLMDLEKLVGGDAEMFWRGARPGFQAMVDKDFQMTPDDKADLLEQLDEYEHHLRRMLVNEGVKYEALAQQIAEPGTHVDIQIQMISAVTGIPKRILTGTERGELSSNQDAKEWRTYVQARREDHAEIHIVRPFVDRCMELGILPKAVTGDYTVLWSDLFAMSEAEMVKIGLDRSTALRNYVGAPIAEAVIPPESFLEFFLGFNSDQINLINQMADSQILAEQTAIIQGPKDVKKPSEPRVTPKTTAI